MLFLHQLQWLYHFYPSFFKCDIDTDLWVLNYPCIPEVNSTWSWCMILFMYYWILFANILLRTVFHLFVRPVIFVFLWRPYVALVLKYCYPCKVSLKCSSSVFWKNSEGLVFLFHRLSEATWSWTFVCWEVFDYWSNLILCYEYFTPHYRKL